MHSIKLSGALGIVAAVALGHPAAALDASSFVQRATSNSMFEVQSGKLAQEKARAAALKTFGERMVRDHSKITAELKSLLSNQPVVEVDGLPQEVDETHAQKLEKLRSATEGFDLLYYDMQIAAHKSAVALFREEASEGADPELKAWAGAILPRLEQHLGTIQQIHRPPKEYGPVLTKAPMVRDTVVPAEETREAAALVDDAADVVRQMKRDRGVADLLERAHGVFIVPYFARATAGIGVRGGSGVMLEQRSGEWGNPGFYDFGAISIGLQGGISGGSIAYILMSDAAVESFRNESNFSLNADAGLSIIDYSAIAQGSIGKGDVIVWSDTEGLFAGVALSVSDIIWDEEEVRGYYGETLTPRQVFNSDGQKFTEAQQLKKVLE